MRKALNLFVGICSLVLVFACGSAKDVQTYMVNSEKIDCMGVAPMKCLQIKNLTKGDTEWQSMYGNIEGFDYEPGYIYKIEVKEEKLDTKNLPADASSIKYKLVKVVSKEKATK